ncbi:MAG: hypothetical protein ACYCX2_08185 [Christensenellales bacterium]
MQPADFKKMAVFCFLCVLILLACYGTVSLLSPNAAPAAADLDDAKGTIQIEVLDAFSETGISAARVIIPEIAESFLTDAKGKTPLITVPVYTNAVYEKIFPQTWGEITIIVLKDGYVPYALFHTQITENGTRIGPKILLFPTGSTSSDQPFIIVEGPKREWVNQLIAHILSALNK